MHHHRPGYDRDRTAEDFKRSTGTFVSVGPLRVRITVAGDPCVKNVVIIRLNRDDLGALIGPRPDACRKLAGLADNTPQPEVLHHPAVRALFQALADTLWREATDSASRVARLHALAAPPSIDQGEITDTGSINQRAVLTHRAASVEALHQGRATNCGRPAPAAASACSGRWRPWWSGAPSRVLIAGGGCQPVACTQGSRGRDLGQN